MIGDLERFKAVEVVEGRRYLVRRSLRVYEAFRTVGMRVPGKVLEVGLVCPETVDTR